VVVVEEREGSKGRDGNCRYLSEKSMLRSLPNRYLNCLVSKTTTMIVLGVRINRDSSRVRESV